MSEYNIDIKKALTDDDIKSISQIAEIVWHQTYDWLLEPGQVDYMLKKYQSPEALRSQIKNDGYEYYLISTSGEKAGFIGFTAKYEKDDEMFLSKVYLKEEFRRRGAFKLALEVCLEEARRLKLKTVTLTVNKNNVHAISVYEHYGFKKFDSVVSDIGGGYVMDDYIMKYSL